MDTIISKLFHKVKLTTTGSITYRSIDNVEQKDREDLLTYMIGTTHVDVICGFKGNIFEGTDVGKKWIYAEYDQKSDRVIIDRSLIKRDDRVVIVDDQLDRGDRAIILANAVSCSGAIPVLFCFLFELSDLWGYAEIVKAYPNSNVVCAMEYSAYDKKVMPVQLRRL